ncbi:disease resistance protein L6-like [Nymphaea colorata]|nr:disease resistance protein L6-like [Nymphaea colorata]
MSSSEYDVFLSFRGMDTRTTFTDHLYHSLKRVATVFRDSEGLERGKEMSELFGVIERSEIFIPIFSGNYADSKWCLQEIERIVKVAVEGERRRLILPVFYRTEPTHVRHQTGPFEAPFRKHEEDDKVEEETVKKWREALSIAAGFSGYERKNASYLMDSSRMLHIFKEDITITNTGEGTCMLQRILQNNSVLIVLDDVDQVEQVEALD